MIFLEKSGLFYFFILLIGFLLFLKEDVSSNREIIKYKNGKTYGITRGLFTNQFDSYYERGLSYADGCFWKEAESDLRYALKGKNEENAWLRTAGLDFIEYFPHRELGIVLYEQGKLEESIDELTLSINMVGSAKAKHYLDRARKSWIEKNNLDHKPPQISIIKAPQEINAFLVTIEVIIEDDTFVSKIMVGDRKIDIDVSKKEVSFETEIPVVNGKNEISVLAEDLVGKKNKEIIVVNVDTVGPIVGIQKPFYNDHNSITLKGYASDDSGIEECFIDNKKISYGSLKNLKIDEIIHLQPNQKELVVKVKDRAGNITSANINLSYNESKTSEKMLAYSNNVLADNDNFIFTQLIASKTEPKDEIQPVIKLKGEPNRITHLDVAFIEGETSDNEEVKNIRIFGEDILDKKERLLDYQENSNQRDTIFFNRIIKLNTNNNIVMASSKDFAGNKGETKISIIRQKLSVQDIGSRLKVGMEKFISDKERMLSSGFEQKLVDSILKFKRFDLRDIDVLKELGINIKQLDYILKGNIIENSEKKSVTISVQLVDTKKGGFIISPDVYDENIDKSKFDQLAEGMALKIVEQLPLIEGAVLKVNGKKITASIGKKHNIKEGMNLIVYRLGDPITDTDGRPIDQDVQELGQAIIETVKERTCEAILTKKENEIQINDFIITQ